MTTPRTLLSLAGADPAPAPVSEAALVLIDCQMEYVDGALPLTGVDAALDEVARLLDRFRSAGAPVVHVVHRGNPGGLFDPEGPSGQVATRAAARDGETVVEKTLPNLNRSRRLRNRCSAIWRRCRTYARSARS
jgi:hypothetical protein